MHGSGVGSVVEQSMARQKPVVEGWGWNGYLQRSVAGAVASSLRKPGFGGLSAQVNTERVVVVGMLFSHVV